MLDNRRLSANASREEKLEWALRDAREFASAVLDTVAALVVVLDRHGRIVRFNRMCQETTGYLLAEAEGRVIWEFLLAPEDVEGVKRVFTRLEREHIACAFENAWITKTGERRLISWSNSVLLDGNGEVLWIIGTGLDITEKKLAERQIKADQEKLHALFEKSPDAYYLIDLKGNFVDGNRAAEETVGMPRDALIGKNFLELGLLRGTQLARAARLLAQNMAGKSAGPEVFTLHKGGGGKVDVEIRTHPLRIDGKRLVLGCARDISEQRRAEAALREREQTLSAITSSARDGIIMVDGRGRVSFWNEAATRIFGWREDEVIGKGVHSLLVPPGDQGLPEEALKVFGRTGSGRAVGQTLELWASHKHGGEFPVELSLSSVRLNDEWQAVGIVRDISERKRVERALREAKENADTANTAKTYFLANMSHEIRTPMNAIVGLSNLLLDTDFDERQRVYLETVRNSADSLLLLINDILDYSRIEAGKLDLKIVDFDLGVTVENVINRLSRSAARKGLSVHLSVEADVPVAVRGDAARLRQVITNLVDNAVKFSERGRVVIRASLKEQTRTHACVCFTIIDTGIGIAAGRQEQLFRSFTQADASHARRFGGTGLGLAIAKSLVEMMGGQIGVESEEGKGSAFWFTVCLKKQARRGSGEDNAARAEGANGTSSEPAVPEPVSQKRSNRVRVLVVEDNAVNRMVALRLLEKSGHIAEAVSGGAEAIKALSNGFYDIVLMDIQMPGMDGFEATHRVRDPQSPVLNQKVPIIAMTAHAMENDRKRCLAEGMDDYVSKPIQLKLLNEAIERWR